MQNQVYTVGATQITLGTLGASVFPTRISPPSICCGVRVKLLGASGSTVMILPIGASGASIGGATAVVQGWPITTTEPYPINGPAAFYIAATGATAVIALWFDYSASGVTLS